MNGGGGYDDWWFEIDNKKGKKHLYLDLIEKAVNLELLESFFVDTETYQIKMNYARKSTNGSIIDGTISVYY